MSLNGATHVIFQSLSTTCLHRYRLYIQIKNCDTNMKSPLADKFWTNQRRDKTDFWPIRGVQIKTFNQ